MKKVRCIEESIMYKLKKGETYEVTREYENVDGEFYDLSNGMVGIYQNRFEDVVETENNSVTDYIREEQLKLFSRIRKLEEIEQKRWERKEEIKANIKALLTIIVLSLVGVLAVVGIVHLIQL